MIILTLFIYLLSLYELYELRGHNAMPEAIKTCILVNFELTGRNAIPEAKYIQT